MKNKIILSVAVGLLLLGSQVFANVDYNVDDKIQKMKTELNLTDTQVNAVKPILEEFKTKKQSLKGSEESAASKQQMEQYKMEKEQKLSQVLTSDQMVKFRNMKEDHKKESSGTY